MSEIMRELSYLRLRLSSQRPNQNILQISLGRWSCMEATHHVTASLQRSLVYCFFREGRLIFRKAGWAV
jgi:hypothetical protein